MQKKQKKKKKIIDKQKNKKEKYTRVDVYMNTTCVRISLDIAMPRVYFFIYMSLARE